MPETRLQPLKDDLALLLDVAKEAGALALSYFGQDPKTWMKSGNSPVTEADMAVDALLKRRLLEARPDYGWISEETIDERPKASRARSFVIDPIDGTRGFIDGDKYWCVSLAIIEQDRPVIGVLQCPVTQDVYAASKGGGAVLNGKTIECGKAHDDKVVVSGVSSLLRKIPKATLARLHVYRYVPSLAYRLALAASGAIDAVLIRPNCHDWDIAAADLILSEAGGELMTMQGQSICYGQKPYSHGLLLGTKPDCAQNMQTLIHNLNSA